MSNTFKCKSVKTENVKFLFSFNLLDKQNEYYLKPLKNLTSDLHKCEKCY